jgi:hypothetical protein
MVLFTLIDGKKGIGDTLVLVTAYYEPLTFSEWLFLGKCYLDSEAMYYPIRSGYVGKAMLMNALTEISHGVPFDNVLERYKLKRKGRNLNIIDKRKLTLKKSQMETEFRSSSKPLSKIGEPHR